MNNWQEVRLEDIIDVNPSVNLKKGEEYPFIDIDKVSPSLRTVTNEETKIYDGQGSKFCPGDTVFSRITPCLENRKIAQVSTSEPGFGSTEFYVFRAKKNLADPDYTYFLTSSDAVVLPAINSMSGASGRQRADKRFIQRHKLKVPSVPEQRKIAGILSAYDNLIELNNKRIKVLEQMAENLFKEWFVRFRFPGHETAEFENGLPKGWSICKLGDITHIKAGGDRPEICSETPTEVTSVPVFSNGIDNEGLYGYTKNPEIEKESVTISARGTVGYVCLRRVPYVPIVRLIAIIPSINSLPAIYLFYYFRQDSIIANGTSQQQITVPMVSKKRIIVPPIQLLSEFERFEKPVWDEMDNIKKQNNELAKQRDLLLPRLLSGKLEVF